MYYMRGMLFPYFRIIPELPPVSAVCYGRGDS